MSAKYACLRLIAILALALCYGNVYAEDEGPQTTEINGDNPKVVEKDKPQVIKADEKWLVTESGTIVIEELGSIANRGEIDNSGRIDVSGSLLNNATIINRDEVYVDTSGSLESYKSFINDGVLVNKGKVTINKGEIVNTGNIVNKDTLKITDDAYYSGDGSINNSGSILLGDMLDVDGNSTVHAAFGAILNDSGAVISFSGCEAIVEKLELKDGSSGSVITGTVTQFGEVDVKGATLVVTSGSTFDGDVAANALQTMEGTDNTFKQAVNAHTIISGENGINNFDGTVAATAINVNGTDNFGGAVTGGMEISSTGTANFKDGSSYAGGTINNNNSLNFREGSTFANGTINNNQHLTFENGSAFTKGTINNYGTVTLGDMASVKNAFNNIANSSKATIAFGGTGPVTENLVLQSGSSGTVDTGTVTSFQGMDVKDAKLVISSPGTRFGGNVNSDHRDDTAIWVAGSTTFEKAVTGNLRADAEMAFDSTGNYSKGNMSLNADLTNAGDITINKDKALYFDEDLINFDNSGTLTFDKGSKFDAETDSGKDHVIRNTGTITFSEMENLNAAFDSTLNDGFVTFKDLISIDNDLAVRDGSTGVVNTGSVSSFKGVDVKEGKLEIEQAGTLFDGNVASSHTDLDAIHVKKSATFLQEVRGNLTADGETIFSGENARYSAGSLTVNATVHNTGGFIDLSQNRSLILNNADVNNAGVMTFAKESAFAYSGNSFINNKESGSITTNVAMTSLSDLVSRTNLETGSTFNFKATEDYFLTKDLAFQPIEQGAYINFDAGGNALTFGKNYTFDSANLSLAGGNYILGNGVRLSAGNTGTFTVANGAIMHNNIAGSTARITAAESNINGGISIGTSTGSVFFDGNLTFNAGSSIQLVADANGIGKIGTYNNGAVIIGDTTYIAIDGSLEDAQNAGAFIIAGADDPDSRAKIAVLSSNENWVAGKDNLYDVRSRFEFGYDEHGDVIVIGRKDTGSILDPDPDPTDPVTPGGPGPTDPIIPGGPTDPSIPGGPTDPSTPGGPTDPTTPGSPSGPSTPWNPTDPTDPSNPGDPSSSDRAGNYLSENKVNGSQYIDDLYDHISADMDREIGYTIDRIAVLDYETRLNAFGQLIGEYGANSADGAAYATELFFKTVYNHMNFSVIQQLVGDTAALPGSNSAFAQMESAGTTIHDASGYRYQESIGSIWAGFLGSWSKQKSKNRLYGYDNDTYGFILGYDRQIDRLNIGFAGSYQRGYLDVDGVATKYKSHFMNLGLYGSYVLENGLYAKAGIGYSHGWNKYNVNMILGGQKHGSFNNDAFSANTEIGYAISLPASIKIIPSIGLRYSHLRQDAWTESLHGGNRNIANWFAKKKYNYVDIPIDVRVAKSFCLNGIVLTPEVHAGWTYAAKHERPNVTTGFVGTDRGFTVFGANPGRSRFVTGASFKGRFTENFEASLDYNLETRSKFTDHSLSLSAIVTF